MPDTYRIAVDIEIEDTQLFQDSLAPRADEDALFEAMTATKASPAETGFEIISSRIEDTGEGRLRFCAEIRIIDEARLLEACRSAWRECWGGDADAPSDPGTAAMELLFQSNENPSPDVLGFAFVSDEVSPIQDPEMSDAPSM